MSCKKKKKKLSGWAPRCCGYTYSFLATRMTITTRYTTHNIALIYFTLRTSKINKYILSNLKIGEFFPNPYVYFNNLYLNDTVFGIKIAWRRNIRYIYIYSWIITDWKRWVWNENVIYVKEAITLLLFQRFHTNFRYILYIYFTISHLIYLVFLDCALSTYLHVTSRYIKYRYSCQYSLQYVMVRSILNLFNLWTNSPHFYCTYISLFSPSLVFLFS